MDKPWGSPGDFWLTSWQEAEYCAVAWMVHLGFDDARLTGAGADAGVDVTANRAVAQVKWQAAAVGRPEVQRLVGARGRITDQWCVFFSGAGYSAAACTYASDNGVALFQYNQVGHLSWANEHGQSLLDATAARLEQDRRHKRNRSHQTDQTDRPEPAESTHPTNAGVWADGSVPSMVLSSRQADGWSPQRNLSVVFVASIVSTLIVVGISAMFARGELTPSILLVISIGTGAYVVLLRTAARGIEATNRAMWLGVSGAAGVGLGALWWMAFALQLENDQGQPSALVTALLLLAILATVVGRRIFA